MPAVTASPDAPPTTVTPRPSRPRRHPEGFLVVDVSGHAEHRRVRRELGGAPHEPLEFPRRAERIDRRDEEPARRRDGQHLAEALERGARRLDEDLRDERPEPLADVRGAVLLGLVEDDGGGRDAGRLEVAEHVSDQRASRDLDHGLGDAEGLQPGPLAGGDDGARDDRAHAHLRDGVTGRLRPRRVLAGLRPCPLEAEDVPAQQDHETRHEPEELAPPPHQGVRRSLRRREPDERVDADAHALGAPDAAGNEEQDVVQDHRERLDRDGRRPAVRGERSRRISQVSTRPPHQPTRHQATAAPKDPLFSR